MAEPEELALAHRCCLVAIDSQSWLSTFVVGPSMWFIPWKRVSRGVDCDVASQARTSLPHPDTRRDSVLQNKSGLFESSNLRDNFQCEGEDIRKVAPMVYESPVVTGSSLRGLVLAFTQHSG